MLYVTYNDAPSGIYYSQVTDVCKYISEQYRLKVKLLAFISIRDFAENRRKIKANFSSAIVVPMFPKVRFWKVNTISLLIISLFLGERKIMARGVFATCMALYLSKFGWLKRVVFDARGAYSAELTEYNVVEEKSIIKKIAKLERYAVWNSDYRLAVSNKLVDYWRDKYNYFDSDYVVIPCTLSGLFLKDIPASSVISQYKQELGFGHSDIIITYSGSSAGWQSFHLVDKFIYRLLLENVSVKIVFLAKETPVDFMSYKEFSSRFLIKWVNPDEVYKLLVCCDYGIIIREESITNKVASPVKFAEYLACGLDVIISEHIGDYSDFVNKQRCGTVLTDASKPILLPPLSYERKTENYLLARKYFSKKSYYESYLKLALH